jgi:ferredoxin
MALTAAYEACDRRDSIISGHGARAGRREGESTMKVVVNYDLCESNAVCMGIAPEVFEVRDDDFLYLLDEHPPESMRPKIEQAVRQCPKQAISIEED